MPMPPRPGGVEMATMVSSRFMQLVIVVIRVSDGQAGSPVLHTLPSPERRPAWRCCFVVLREDHYSAFRAHAFAFSAQVLEVT